MSKWRIIAEERTELYSPIGLRPMDEFTGSTPIGRVQSHLQVSDGSGGWRKTDAKPVVTGSGVITYPGLERRVKVAGPPRRYRILLETDFYLPFYRATTEGVEFNAHPHNDVNPPQIIASQIQEVFLTPATNYPFPGHLLVLRGVVVDPAGGKVEDALVTEGVRERVISDARGAFALPLRWVQQNAQIFINAEHPKTGRAGMIQVLLPAAIRRSQTIPIF